MSNLNGIGSAQPFSNVEQNVASSAAEKLARQHTASLGVNQHGNVGSGAGTASLSATAGMLSAGLSQSDVRMDRVTALQQSIGTGTYNVTASDVAGKIFSALLN